MPMNQRIFESFDLATGEYLASTFSESTPPAGFIFGSGEPVPFLPGDGYCAVVFAVEVSGTGALDFRPASQTTAGGGVAKQSAVKITAASGPTDIGPLDGRHFFRKGAIVLEAGTTAVVTPVLDGDWNGA